MKQTVLVLFLILLVALAGCQYLKPALAPNTDCASGVVDTQTPAVTGAVTTAIPAEEKMRDGVPVRTVTEGEKVSFPNLKAVDPDGDKITYAFSSPLDAKGEWQTKTGDAGEYKIVITASDGKTTTKQDVIIKVLAGNKAPVIELADVKVKEGEQVTLAPKVSDADGDKLTTTYSGWMTTNTKKTSFSDAGTHAVTVTADDGKAKTTKTVNVLVEDVNQKPVLNQLQDLAVKEGDLIELLPKAMDADGDKLMFSYSAPFSANGTWQTKKGDEGVKKVTVTVADGKGGSASATFIVAVESTNKAPAITGPASLSFKEGDTVDLSKAFTVTDEDKDAVTVTYAGWMTSAVKTTSYADAGSYSVVITADDKNNEPVKKTVSIVVSDVNRAPTFDSSSFN